MNDFSTSDQGIIILDKSVRSSQFPFYCYDLHLFGSWADILG